MNLKKNITHWLCLFFITQLLVACGGSKSTNDTSTPTVPNTPVVKDTTAPTITLTGQASITLTQGENYVEAGATATDDVDGSVTVTISGTPDSASVGEYTVTYTATDKAGNRSTVKRTIIVISSGSSTPFITRWKTDNKGSSDGNQIKITTSGTGYNYEVSWGDGLVEKNIQGDITHTYNAPGTYEVTITGNFPRIVFFPIVPGFTEETSDAKKLLSVEQWGDQKWQSMENAFLGSSNLVINARDEPNLSQVTSMHNMFSGAASLNQDISGWDVSSVKDMSYMFAGATAFNQDIGNWDVSSVLDMTHMFKGATAFNQDIGNWDVSSVETMIGTFNNSEAFNQNIGRWDVSSVLDISHMFAGATVFNQDIGNWNVSSVETMVATFSSADAFNQNIGRWDVSSVLDMSTMFFSAISFNQDISEWDVSSVSHMTLLFTDARSFDQDISEWDVSSVKGMYNMFFRGNLSTANYDKILLGWSMQSLQKNVSFSAGEAKYSDLAMVKNSRNILIDVFKWDIRDGGVAP